MSRAIINEHEYSYNVDAYVSWKIALEELKMKN